MDLGGSDDRYAPSADWIFACHPSMREGGDTMRVVCREARSVGGNPNTGPTAREPATIRACFEGGAVDAVQGVQGNACLAADGGRAVAGGAVDGAVRVGSVGGWRVMVNGGVAGARRLQMA